MLKKIIIGLVCLVLAAVGLGIVFGAPASASEGDQPCVPSDAYDETIHHDAVTHVVHHDAVTHVVHHDAVPAGPDLWWNWSPNKDQGPFDGPPSFPTDDRGTWQGPHENGGPDQDTYGTFNSSNSDNGRASWFHREHGTPGVDAYDETVVDQEAYDETVVDQEAYDEVIHHDAVTCPPNPGDKPDPITASVGSEGYGCGNNYSVVTIETYTQDWVLSEDGSEWVPADPVYTSETHHKPHAVVPCPTNNPPKQPSAPVKHAAAVPLVIDAGL